MRTVAIGGDRQVFTAVRDTSGGVDGRDTGHIGGDAEAGFSFCVGGDRIELAGAGVTRTGQGEGDIDTRCRHPVIITDLHLDKRSELMVCSYGVGSIRADADACIPPGLGGRIRIFANTIGRDRNTDTAVFNGS